MAEVSSSQSTPMVVGNNNFVSQYLTFPALPAATNAKPNKKLPPYKQPMLG